MMDLEFPSDPFSMDTDADLEGVPPSSPSGPMTIRQPSSSDSDLVVSDNNLQFSTLSQAAPQQRDPGTDLRDLASVDARLARLCAAWASLPEHVILALVESAGVVEAERLQPPS